MQTASDEPFLMQQARRSVRPVLFQTDDPTYRLSTYGGTGFLVHTTTKVYFVTCKHVFHDFEPEQIVVPKMRNAKGTLCLAPISSLFTIESPIMDAQDSDLLDLAVCCFCAAIGPDFFLEDPIDIRSFTKDEIDVGDELIAFGHPKDRLEINPPTINYNTYQIHFHVGEHSPSDRLLAVGQRDKGVGLVEGLQGMSGSLVYNKTKDCLAGMIMRAGGSAQGPLSFYFLRFLHIAKFVMSLEQKSNKVEYAQ
jgi:hypothetical protein